MELTSLTTEYMAMIDIHIASAGVCLVLLLTACTVLILNIRRYYKCKLYNDFLKQQLFLEKNLERRVDDIYEQSRMMRHDIKHYLTAVLGLVVNEDYKEAEKLIIDIIGKTSEKTMINYSACSTINAVLNLKSDECKKKNIAFDINVSGSIPNEQQINIAIVLSNLLDNAIEATQKSEKKIIKLEMYEQKGMFYIMMENTFDGKINNGKKVESSKSDRWQHGLGILSIKKLVKDLDGVYEKYVEGDVFFNYLSIPFQVKLLDKKTD